MYPKQNHEENSELPVPFDLLVCVNLQDAIFANFILLSSFWQLMLGTNRDW
jgi:hypothetical protein